jgi:membrane associated rhomboid family serine protease
MGLYDRDYEHKKSGYLSDNASQMGMAFPEMTPVVKWFLIINATVYLLQALGMDEMLTGWFSVFPTSLSTIFQLWRLVTYQFLHGGVMHILFNMLGLFFLGPTLERYWGSRRFLVFYLSCGIAGGLFYTLLVVTGFLPAGSMVGASGAILGMLAACAILFPHFVVFILVFPVPIRIAAITFTVMYLVAVVSRGSNAGGEAAHLAGMVTGAVYVFSQSWRTEWRLKIRSLRWEKKIAAERKLQIEVDRILEKVHKQGVHGLTLKEKRILRRATKIEQMRNRL